MNATCKVDLLPSKPALFQEAWNSWRMVLLSLKQEAIAGVGLAISGLTATVATAHDPPPQSYTDLSFLLSPAFVLSIALSAPFLIALIVRLFRR